MDQDKKNATGAPSSDTTSALFVSARKKQLEQQEADQRAKEKEEKRLAAEAEVRRLEAEVEERRRKATEEANRVAFEPADKPKIEPSAPITKPVNQGGGFADLLKNKMMLGIIGGGAAVIVLVVVLVFTLGRGKDGNAVADAETSSPPTQKIEETTKPVISDEPEEPSETVTPDEPEPTQQDTAPEGFSTFEDPDTGIQLYYPSDMEAEPYLNSPNEEIVTINSDDAMLCVMNFTQFFDETVATSNYSDSIILRMFSNAFLLMYSETIFGTANWATALGTQDFTAALEAGVAKELTPQTGRSFDILAHFNVTLDIEGSEVFAYMALTQFHDVDYKVLNVIIWNPDTETYGLLEDALLSERIAAKG
jgi:hypothetical protein